MPTLHSFNQGVFLVGARSTPNLDACLGWKNFSILWQTIAMKHLQPRLVAHSAESWRCSACKEIFLLGIESDGLLTPLEQEVVMHERFATHVCEKHSRKDPNSQNVVGTGKSRKSA